MRKLTVFFSVLFLSVVAAVSSYGKAVDENTAKTIGANFLLSNQIPGIQSSTDLVTAYVATGQVNGVSVVDYYVFNFTGGKGFVMVSGDDVVRPILAYSFQSIFDLSNMSPSTQTWVEGYKNRINYCIANNIPTKASVAQKWDELSAVTNKAAARTTSLFPSPTYYLAATTWDQDPGYDRYCPTGTVTGCVPTAMSQVMKFWNWPTVGTGAHTYTPSGYTSQNVDFGNTIYDWSEMTSFPAAQCKATDSLMYHAGVSVEAAYGPASAGGTGAYVTKSESPVVNCAEYSLRTYFHYKSTVHGELRDGTPGNLGGFLVPAQALISETAWINMLETELNAGRPMLYKGQETGGDGHCWVLDGFESSNLMHFNWGWSGFGDGYYTVDDLTPTMVGVGSGSGTFNTDQGVVMGIQPDSFPSNPGNIQMQSELNIAASSAIPYNSTFSVVATVNNSGSSAFNGTFAAQVYDTNNHYVATIGTSSTESLAAGASSSALTLTTTGIRNMIPAPYYVRLYYQASGASTWTPVANNGNYINYNYIDVRNDGITSTSQLELSTAIHISTPLPAIIGNPFTFNTNIFYLDRTGMSGSFNGSLQATATNISTGTSYTIQLYTAQSISSGAQPGITFSTSSLSVPAGTYAIAVQAQPGGSGSFNYIGSEYYTNPILISINHGVGVPNVTAAADNIFVYPNPARETINIATNGVEIGQVTVVDIQGREILKTQADKSQQVISIPVAGFASGMYFVQMQTNEGVVSKKVVVTE